MVHKDLVAVIRDLEARTRAPVSTGDLAASLNYTPQHTRRLLQPLLDSGAVVRVGAGPAARLVIPKPERVTQIADTVRDLTQMLEARGFTWEDLRAFVGAGVAS